MATKYTKTLVLKTTDGDVTLTGAAAHALQNRLDNDARFFHFTAVTGAGTDAESHKTENYYNIASSSCGACLFATVTSGTTTAADAPCEEALMACAPAIVSIAPATVDVAGGDTVVITANNIDSTAIVLVDGAVVAGTVSGNTITITAPAHEAGEVKVSVIAGGKQSDEATLTYEAEEVAED